jgi:hypothetical protein
MFTESRSVCLVGLDESFENLIVSLTPAARVLSFSAPAFSAHEIESGALNLLNDIYNDRSELEEYKVRVTYGKCLL